MHVEAGDTTAATVRMTGIDVHRSDPSSRSPDPSSPNSLPPCEVGGESRTSRLIAVLVVHRLPALRIRALFLRSSL
jgi:hypothetical protein